MGCDQSFMLFIYLIMNHPTDHQYTWNDNEVLWISANCDTKYRNNQEISSREVSEMISRLEGGDTVSEWVRIRQILLQLEAEEEHWKNIQGVLPQTPLPDLDVFFVITPKPKQATATQPKSNPK